MTEPDPMVEKYADLLCAALGHSHSGRPRCAAVVLAERLLAVHDAPEPKPEPSIHEVLFWEVRSGPTRDEREWADWIVQYCRGRIEARTGFDHDTPLIPEAWGDGWDACAKAVLDLFEIPEGRAANGYVDHDAEVRSIIEEKMRMQTSTGPVASLGLCGERHPTESRCVCNRAAGHGGQHQGFDRTQTRLVNWID